MVLDWREVDGKARRGVRISTKNIQITTVSLLAAVFFSSGGGGGGVRWSKR